MSTGPLNEPCQEETQASEQRGVVIYHSVDTPHPVSKQLRQVGGKECKITASASCGEPQQAMRANARRKGLRKKETETPDVVSEAQSASSESLLDVSNTAKTQRLPASDTEDPSPTPVAS